ILSSGEEGGMLRCPEPRKGGRRRIGTVRAEPGWPVGNSSIAWARVWSWLSSTGAELRIENFEVSYEDVAPLKWFRPYLHEKVLQRNPRGSLSRRPAFHPSSSPGR